jgi:hypothetical protein
MFLLKMLCHPEERSDEGSAVVFRRVGSEYTVGLQERKCMEKLSKDNRRFLTALGMTAGFMKNRERMIRFLTTAMLIAATLSGASQAMPSTSAETLNGKHVVLADTVRGHAAVLVAGFSHEGGTKVSEWMKALRGDSAFAAVDVYEIAMLEGAPGIIRGMIKSGMRKGTTPAEQEHTLVMTQDQKQWEKFFGVADDKEPYVVLLNANGEVVWRGHGPVATIEPQLKGALKQ